MSYLVSFDTRNSTLPNGTPMDTVLSVYTTPVGYTIIYTTNNGVISYTETPSSGTLNPTNELMNFTDLTLVTNNDDDPNSVSWPLTSRVSFQATIGTTYYFQLDGSTKLYGTNEQGYISLNWGPSLAAGALGFVTNVFSFGQLDDTFEYASDGTIDPSLAGPFEYRGAGQWANSTGGGPIYGAEALVATTNIYGTTTEEGECRVTVTRTGAYNGRILVDLILTNDYYSNYYTTNIWIENIAYSLQNYDTNTNSATFGEPIGAAQIATNVWLTNFNVDLQLGYDSQGLMSSYDILLNYQLARTNIPKAQPPLKVDSYRIDH